MQMISAIYLDFDNVYGSLYSKSPDAAYNFAKTPKNWLSAFAEMRVNENEEVNHNFVVRRCYMNPVGRIQGSPFVFSHFRQDFVRSGWEVIDTPPLTNRGKSSADMHIVMDVMDNVQGFPQINEYLIMASDADFTPLVIRLRKHMKKTIIYTTSNTAAAYENACDTAISEELLIEFLLPEEEAPDDSALGKPMAGPSVEPAAVSPARLVTVEAPIMIEDVARTLRDYLKMRGPGAHAPAATVGHVLMKGHGKEIANGWLGHESLSRLLYALKDDFVYDGYRVSLREHSPANDDSVQTIEE